MAYGKNGIAYTIHIKSKFVIKEIQIQTNLQWYHRQIFSVIILFISKIYLILVHLYALTMIQYGPHQVGVFLKMRFPRSH